MTNGPWALECPVISVAREPGSKWANNHLLVFKLNVWFIDRMLWSCRADYVPSLKQASLEKVQKINKPKKQRRQQNQTDKSRRHYCAQFARLSLKFKMLLGHWIHISSKTNRLKHPRTTLLRRLQKVEHLLSLLSVDNPECWIKRNLSPPPHLYPQLWSLSRTRSTKCCLCTSLWILGKTGSGARMTQTMWCWQGTSSIYIVIFVRLNLCIRCFSQNDLSLKCRLRVSKDTDETESDTCMCTVLQAAVCRCVGIDLWLQISHTHCRWQ